MHQRGYLKAELNDCANFGEKSSLVDKKVEYDQRYFQSGRADIIQFISDVRK